MFTVLPDDKSVHTYTFLTQELLCGGTDLALRSLQRHEGGEEGGTPRISLLEAAIDGIVTNNLDICIYSDI